MKIDLNLDAGEWAELTTEIAAREQTLFSLVTSVNIACGGHAGSEESMRLCVQWARANGCAVGAHPSYPDRANFGRAIVVGMSETDLRRSIAKQIAALTKICNEEGAKLSHVKFHGTLYHDVSADVALARMLVEDLPADIFLAGLAGSRGNSEWRAMGRTVLDEGFVDRRYESGDFRALVPRGVGSRALLDSLSAMQSQALSLVRKNFDTLCIHGDREDAIAIARAVREHLEAAGVRVIKV